MCLLKCAEIARENIYEELLGKIYEIKWKLYFYL